jgi:hypothetical protein
MANQHIGDILEYLAAAHIFEWAILLGTIILLGVILEHLLNRKMANPVLERRRRIGDRRKSNRESFRHTFWAVSDRRRK